MKIKIIFFFLLLNFSSFGYSQKTDILINPALMKTFWSASWITHPNADLKSYGVYHFRKTFDLNAKPEKFVIHVSADNRYRLFVNGQAVCFGPARGDINHWYFETIDIAPYLKSGKNVLAAVVWNFGELIPIAQITRQTAFILQGNSDIEKIVDTNASWKVIKNNAYSPETESVKRLHQYIVVGPGDIVDAEKYPWNWQNVDYKDSDWLNSKIIFFGKASGVGTGTDWDLLPRDIPMMEETDQNFKSVRRSEGCKVSELFLQGKEFLTIPANSTAKFLLDQGVETVAYPEITVTGSVGTVIEMAYAEALFDKNGKKGNRNDIERKEMNGNADIFKLSSFDEQTFRPLWFRTFRYVEVKIVTQNQPVTIQKIHSTFTAYPFKELASFKSNNDTLSKIWEVGWRTLRLCSNETHYDCPYYEQLQYVADTRIQALVSLYVSGDDRLMRKALVTFDRSRFYEGLTCSRYPCSDMQVIPPFSLFWINMIHDYWMLRDDSTFVKSLLPGVETVLKWYETKLDAKTGMVGFNPYWNFVDWPDAWGWSNVTNSGGIPEGGLTGNSSIISLQYVYALNAAVDLFKANGDVNSANKYHKIAIDVAAATIKNCWDESRGLLADSPMKKEFSQHANIMAIMADAPLPIKSDLLIEKVANDKSLIPATVYYRFYLLRAMKKAGLGNKYLSMLQPWKLMLQTGLTTFAERNDPTRSDCHAWSASPVYELLATVCGIEPAEPGFKSVLISPNLGDLKFVEATMPHPFGMININLKKTKKGGLEGFVILPKGLNGKFTYKNITIDLNQENNKISILKTPLK